MVSRSEIRSVTLATVTGSCGSHVVAVSANSRCHRTNIAMISTSELENPKRAAISRAMRSPLIA